jgi:lysophospholipase L1-like esterase
VGSSLPPVDWTLNRRTPVPWQVVCTRGYMPLTTEGSASYSRYESSLGVNVGPRPVSGLRAVFANRMMSSFGEAAGASDVALQCAIWTRPGSSSWSNGVFFGGILQPTLQAGAPLLISDPLGTLCAPGQALKIQSGAIVAGGGGVAASKVGGGWGQSFGCESNAASSQVYEFSQAMSVPPGGVQSTLTFAPLMILGQPAAPHVAVAIMGASQAQGVGDTADSATGFSGWAERMLIGAAPGGVAHPFVNLSRSGIGTGAAIFPGSLTAWSVVPYCTHVVVELGFNDIASLTLAGIQANLQSIWARAHALGARVWQSTLLPRTSSTDAWASAAGQTVAAGYESAGYPFGSYPAGDAPAGATGTRGALNAWLKAQAGVGLDGVLDGNAVVEDPGARGKWLTSGAANGPTADGQHPSPASHAAIAAAFQPLAAAWTV